MQRVLNEHTSTVHKSRQGTTDEAVCGALKHVSRRHVTPVGNDDGRVSDGVERCGRCFEDGGGY